jgi:hypothetical protein
MTRNWVKEFLESSPWALGAVVAAALLALAFTVLELGSRLWDRLGAKSDAPAMEIAGLGRFLLAPTTPAMQRIALVRSVQEISGLTGGPHRNRVPLWPVHLQVLNPTRAAINLHGCSMRVTLPLDMYKGVKLGSALESSEYFLSDAVASVDARAAGKPIKIQAGEAKRMQLYFIFALLSRPPQRDKPASPAAFTEPAIAEVSCRDDAGRELVARSMVYGDISVESPPRGRKPARP